MLYTLGQGCGLRVYLPIHACKFAGSIFKSVNNKKNRLGSWILKKTSVPPNIF